MDAKLKDKVWRGALAAARKRGMALNLPVISAGRANTDTMAMHDWFRWIIPTYSQEPDVCVGHAWSNWLEAMIRRYISVDAIPAGCQLNGYTVWWKAKQLFYGGCLAGGITLAEGFAALKSLGWIPDDSVLTRVDQNIIAVNSAMDTMPLVNGSLVWDGWFNPNPENGCINEDFSGDRNLKAGHAYCLVGTLRQNGKFFLAFQNSWGPLWGWNGIGILSADTCFTMTIDGPYGVQIDDGWDCGLRRMDGWKKGIISTPSDTQMIRM